MVRYLKVFRKVLIVVLLAGIVVMPSAIYAFLQSSENVPVGGKGSMELPVQTHAQPQVIEGEAATKQGAAGTQSPTFDPSKYAIPLDSGLRGLAPGPRIEVDSSQLQSPYNAVPPTVTWPQNGNCHAALLYCE